MVCKFKTIAQTKRIAFIFLSVSILIFNSCEPPIEEAPENLIPIENVKKIAIELHLAEEFVSLNVQSPDTAKSIYRTMELEVYKKNAVSEETYKTSYQYYLRNIDMFDKMYEEIIDSLAKRESMQKVKPE